MSIGIRKQDYTEETNRTVMNRINRRNLVCWFCPPNKGENKTRTPAHGVKKPRNRIRRGIKNGLY